MKVQFWPQKMKRRSFKRKYQFKNEVCFHMHEDSFVTGEVRSSAVPIVHKNVEGNIKQKYSE
jgi:hypothetical protein